MTRKSLATGLLLALGGGMAMARKPSCPPPLWTVDIASKFGSGVSRGAKRPLNRPIIWGGRGTVFVSPDTLVVYQVVENESPMGLERRTAGGGGGRFILRGVFLDSQNGHEVRQMNWTTTASNYSQVLATHDGRFLVRTGQLLLAYSADFQEIASRSLPVNPKNFLDWWSIMVVPPGRLLFIEHRWQEYKAYHGFYNGPQGDEKSLVDIDTLKTIEAPSPNDVALWPQADRYFPELTERHQPSPLPLAEPLHFGALQKSLDEHEHPYKYCTDSAFVGVSYQTRGFCEKVDVLKPDGHLFWHLELGEHIGFLAIGGNTLAIELDHWSWLDVPPKPVRIAAYDVAQKTEECSVDLRKLRGYEAGDFAVSSDGLLAVRMGNQLSVYKP